MEIKNTVQRWVRFHLIKHWYEKYERILLPAMLLFGVITDAWAFAEIDTVVVLSILGVYLVTSGGIILFLNRYDTKILPDLNRFRCYLRLLSPLLIQFLFGALLNAVFIFYFFSGTLFVSWPFLLLVVFLMISNDVFRHHFVKPLVQVSVYFFLLFSYVSIALPFLFNSLSIWLFIVSGAASIILISVYLFVLTRLAASTKKQSINFILSILVISIFMNALYFFNIVPPIPLALREHLVSHGIVRSAGGYLLHVEKESWWKKIFIGSTFHKSGEESLSVYTAIFAPKNLNAKIIHDWQWYDTTKKEWVSKDRLSFLLTGGRREGFRGYSTKTTVPAGQWRVYVKTERGQVLGRVSFTVVIASESIILKDILK
ncbi:MAG: hypothetical protein A3B90_00565 [Candidatus Magasanikbacteria bacterium RIFCSPHIGHO2_02_FULL_41_13]|uniref:DUF2914 domain-containing protein n=1 Tax=Candidatus Magasanikbacteria bacterium RIFCSPHIGHO2_02_FULL_41_13 TaxID=1798676 RepID=A0A1F6M5X6_9BACT|nr:MAG: hypothetical protein A3B90_00565 [Candidatus Magasanikbacteria bacterium RIFCSPHIGHO2_02_FULL_41_13]